MAQASGYVESSRAKATSLKAALDDLQAVVDEYNALGGQSFVEEYLPTSSEPGFDITSGDFVTWIANMMALLGAVTSNNWDDSLAKMLYQG